MQVTEILVSHWKWFLNKPITKAIIIMHWLTYLFRSDSSRIVDNFIHQSLNVKDIVPSI